MPIDVSFEFDEDEFILRLNSRCAKLPIRVVLLLLLFALDVVVLAGLFKAADGLLLLLLLLERDETDLRELTDIGLAELLAAVLGMLKFANELIFDNKYDADVDLCPIVRLFDLLVDVVVVVVVADSIGDEHLFGCSCCLVSGVSKVESNAW